MRLAMAIAIDPVTVLIPIWTVIAVRTA